MPPRRAVVVADDITGANDTGNQFASRGYRTHVSLRGPDRPVPDRRSAESAPDVLVVDTETRASTPDHAYDAVSRVLQTTDAPVVYKKLDSTLRGNVVAELEAVLDEADPDVLVFAPAFPENDRTTRDGIQFVDGRRVLDAIDGNENPPATSAVPALLSDLSYPVETLSLDVVDDGSDAVRERLAELHTAGSSPLVVASDAMTREHLRSLAVAARSLPADVAYAGSGGLAGVLPLRDSGTDEGALLAVVGSVSRTAMMQLDHLDADAVVSLDAPRAIEDPDAAAADAVDAVVETQRERGHAVLASARTEADVEDTMRAAERLGLGDDAVNRRIAAALSDATDRVNDARTLDGLVTTGGAVTTAVLDELDASWLELTGRAVADGIPLARIRGGDADGTPLVTKAGSFGGTTTIANCLDFFDSR